MRSAIRPAFISPAVRSTIWLERMPCSLSLRPRRSWPTRRSMPTRGRSNLWPSVWSRDKVVRVDLEGRWVLCPGLADRLEGGSPVQPLEVLGEGVGCDKGQDVRLQALQVGVVE